MFKNFWYNIEEKVNYVLPGLKTHITSGLGAVGSTAVVMQQYVTGLPANKYVTSEHLAIATAVLFTLAFWFHGLGDRVENRDA